MNSAFYIPLFSYVLWVSVLYLLLTVMRAPSIWGEGEHSPEAKKYALLEPKASANLSNQFEWPVFFFAISIILIARPELYTQAQLWLAWLFVLGRIVHSVTHIFTHNIKLRGMVFNINFLAVLGMWGVLALKVLNN